MNPRILVKWVWRFLHFLRGQCDVCSNRHAVRLRLAEDDRRLRHLSVVIPCPHCTDAGELIANLPARKPASILPDGAA